MKRSRRKRFRTPHRHQGEGHLQPGSTRPHTGPSKQRQRQPLPEQEQGQQQILNWRCPQLPCQPKERFFEVVVGFRRDLKVLEVLLSMECHGSSLDLPLLDIYFVAAENDRNVFADTFEIAMPVGDIFVRDSGCDVEHDNSALTLDEVSISKTTELLLACSIPNVEANSSEVRRELQRVDLDTESGNIFLFEFTSQVTLNKRSFPSATVADQHKLEGGNYWVAGHIRF